MYGQDKSSKQYKIEVLKLQVHPTCQALTGAAFEREAIGGSCHHGAPASSPHGDSGVTS